MRLTLCTQLGSSVLAGLVRLRDNTAPGLNRGSLPQLYDLESISQPSQRVNRVRAAADCLRSGPRGLAKSMLSPAGSASSAMQ